MPINRSLLASWLCCGMVVGLQNGCEPRSTAPTVPAVAPTMPVPTPSSNAATPPQAMQLVEPTPEVKRMVEMGFLSPGPQFKPIPNDQFETLSSMGSLRFSDSDAELLLQFPNLKTLSLDQSQITDKTLATVAKLTALTELTLERCQISDDGVQQLAPLANLTRLHLSGTKIGNRSIEVIGKSFPKLQFLLIQGTSVNDAGLTELAGLKELKLVDAGSTFATRAGAQKLMQSMSGCQIQATR